MSAVIMLKQRDSIHLMVDAASYFADGTVHAFTDKCQPLPELRCAVAMLGPSRWSNIIVPELRDRFTSFDGLMAGIEPLLRDIFDACHESVASPGLPVAGDLWCIGWSDGGPDGFTIGLDHLDAFNERVAGGAVAAREPFKINMLDAALPINWHPHPMAQQLFDARFPVGDVARLSPDLDLLHLLEIQRRIPFEKCAGAYAVGGYALLTTVDAHGVRQRRVHEWKDRPGEKIQPGPIDWVKWRSSKAAEFGLVPTQIIPLNRHQRRKQRARG